MSAGLKAMVAVSVGTVVQELMRRHPEGKHNQGRFVLEAYIWDEIESLAKGKSKDAWFKMEKDGVYAEPEKTEACDKIVGTTPRFEVHAKVTEPVKRFSDEELAKLLKNSKYKIPEPVTKEFVQKAKVGKTGNLGLSIVERVQDM